MSGSIPEFVLSQAQASISSEFDSSPRHIYQLRDLRRFLTEHREAWSLPPAITASAFIEYLCEQANLRKLTLVSDGGRYSPIVRYSWGEYSPFELAQSLWRNAYFSHGTAVFLHALTMLVPTTLYLNLEQSPKPPPAGQLDQEGIDRAFGSKQRRSRYIFQLDGRRYVRLSGKNTGRYGVSDHTSPEGLTLSVTDLERTLVDIAVRPAYAGGVAEVLNAYREALAQVSVGRLIATLRKLDYRYPYHQAIGFYLERAGLDERRLDRLRALGLEHDFYLTYSMRDTEYSSSWHLYYPKGF